MSTEIETRTVIENEDTVLEALKRGRFELVGEKTQIDVMHDKPDGSLFLSGQKIRIRLEDGNVELTYKGFFQGDSSASRRVELDVGIASDDAESLSQFLESIGYPKLFQIKKIRKTFSNGTVKATIDEWPIIGFMVELEGAEADIKDVADQYFSDFEFRNYRLKELFESKCSREGKSLDELQVAYEDKTGFKLGNLGFLLK